ncbi:signal peptidase complex subunit 1 [Coccinella septempunctata]|uniref:signal peptidase complex subunit 1 n=1 Tax=Coccinella septempunctata TaxID=41139 RepID=UPI001D064CBE|nr:signal peptidase complex subunit 1 [Coccinella septempunctata]
MLEFVDNWHMDYVGQAWAEKLSRIIITLFGIVGLVYGYAIQQFSMTVYILGVGFALASLITIPPWPIYRKNPLNWQPVKNRDKDSHSKKSKKTK